ncbi:MAG: type VI secretion system baseplate subunit TssF [Chromatiaceae bacterium]|nr:type VI secretion system baseplate subunit TssF [Chromatiaceae bacterium]
MDPRFLDLYNRELRHIREMGGEFAAQFPKVASRLGLDSFECADPYVERLLEGFAFLAARVQLKIDSEFPRFTHHLLESVYPHYLTPTPSMAVVRFGPDMMEGSLAEGFDIPRDTALRSLLRKGDATPCTYRTAHDLTLWPLEVERGEYIGSPSALPEVTFPGTAPLKSGIRLRLKVNAGLKFSELAMDTLDIYLRGKDAIPMRLYEHIRSNAVGLAARPAQSKKKSDWIVWDKSHIEPLGFEPEQALLPVGVRSFDGYRLLHEYFAFPQRFMFVRVKGLKPAVRRALDTGLDLLILFDRADPALETQVTSGLFNLHCTPVINLFPKRMDRVHLSQKEHEYHIVPERTRPMDFEVFSVASVVGYGKAVEPEREFLPFYSATHPSFHLSPSAYYTLHREKRLLSSRRQQRNIGPRSSYIGSEIFVALVDAEQAPISTELRQLGVEALCTNRDLPLLMSLGSGSTDFTWDFSGPVDNVRCVSGPSKPRPSPVDGDTHWRLISHLTLNYLSLASGEGAMALRELLGLYAFLNEDQVRKEIEGVASVASKPVYRRIATNAGSAFGRGLEIALDFDETQFEGTGCFLLGAVLEQFLSKYVSLNSFTETVVRTVDRGEIIRWPMRSGRRQVL